MARTTTRRKEEQTAPPTAEEPKVPANTQPGGALSDADFFGEETGFENVDSDDVALPRFTILQGLSPQLNPRSDDHVEGAAIGDIINVATNEILKELPLVVAAYQRRYVEWIPRKTPCPIRGLPQVTGGGLVQDHGTSDEILKECKRWEENASLWTPRGAQLVITGTWYVIRTDTLSTGFIAMGNTHFTASKKILAAVRDEKVLHQGVTRPAPLWYREWIFGSRLRQFEDNEWMTWKSNRGRVLTNVENGRTILDMVKTMRHELAEGGISVDMAAGADAEVEADQAM